MSRVVALIDMVPRFGHTENFYEIFEGDRRSYMTGIMLIPGLVESITIVWLTVLVVFMCTCRESFLSGKAFSSGEGATSRTIFIFSACLVLASSIIFITVGSDSFSDAFDNLDGSKEDLFKLSKEGTDILSNIRIVLLRVSEKNRILKENIAGGICDYLPQEIQVLLDDISKNIASSDYGNQLNQLKVFEDGLGKSFSLENKSHLDGFLKVSEKIIGYMIYGGLPTIITSSILGCGAILSWCGLSSSLFSSFQTYFVLPLCVFIEIIAAQVISLLGIVLIICSDLCTAGEDQNPESSTKIILDANQYDEVVRQALDHYLVDGCRTPSPFGGLIETQDALKDILREMNDVVDKIHPYFEGVCKDNSTELNTLLLDSNTDLISLDSAIQKGLDVTGCESVNSLFVTSTHEGICTSVPDAIWWMFWCFAVVWVGGLFMLTTRAACKPNRR